MCVNYKVIGSVWQLTPIVKYGQALRWSTTFRIPSYRQAILVGWIWYRAAGRFDFCSLTNDWVITICCSCRVLYYAFLWWLRFTYLTKYWVDRLFCKCYLEQKIAYTKMLLAKKKVFLKLAFFSPLIFFSSCCFFLLCEVVLDIEGVPNLFYSFSFNHRSHLRTTQIQQCANIKIISCQNKLKQ